MQADCKTWFIMFPVSGEMAFPVMLALTLREGYLNKWSRIRCCSRRKPLINITHTRQMHGP